MKKNLCEYLIGSIKNYKISILQVVSLVLMAFVVQPCATLFYQPQYPQQFREECLWKK